MREANTSLLDLFRLVYAIDLWFLYLSETVNNIKFIKKIPPCYSLLGQQNSMAFEFGSKSKDQTPIPKFTGVVGTE